MVGRGRTGAVLVVAAVTAVTAVAGLAAPSHAATAPAGGSPPPEVRVDQVGYPTTAPKVARVMAAGPTAGLSFEVVAADGTVVDQGTAGPDEGRWNGRYRHVSTLTFSGVTAPGTYHLVVDTVPPATSPPFAVAPPDTVYAGALADTVAFYEDEQDGPAYVPSALRTAPAHLNDEDAELYATPTMRASGTFRGDLTPLGVTLDASGGWWDAGDYLKFVETTSYVVAVLATTARQFPDQAGAGAGPADLTGEVRFGIEWLEKMWDDRTRTLAYQVGIDEGNRSIVGDHDVWRLPQADDTYGGTAPQDRYLRHRPVFEAGPPGSPISPNLAGRLAADFGLCAQLFGVSDPSFAATCLQDGEDVFALADTSPTGRLLTTAPYAFYPETQWRDDLALGATELARALGPGPARQAYLASAASWTAAYLASPDRDSLNLYDVGGLDEYELATELEATGTTGLAETPATLTAALGAQVAAAGRSAASAPFDQGVPWSSSDTVSHDEGLSVMASEVDALTGSSADASEAQGWMDDVLGDDPWGVSFVIGDGTTFPDCPQHQVANLVGSLDGTGPVLAGAAVEGPTARASRGLVSGMRTCPAGGGDRYAPFDGRGAVYRDDVQSYATDEPAIDLTAAGPLALAWLAASGA